MQRIPSGEVMESPADMPETRNVYANGHVKILARKSSGGSIALATTSQSLSNNAGYIQLAICVGGIYASL
jgi:solute carrier family 35 (UDP-galactose transporter), member B1